MNDRRFDVALKKGTTTLPVSVSEVSASPAHEGLYLLVVERASSRSVRLPAAGFLVVGRAEDADVRLDDQSVSWRHARVMVEDGVVRVVDLDSRNGVRVSGVQITGAREIAAGEVVAIGGVELILHGGSRARSARTLLAAPDTFARLQHEVARALECDRSLSVAVVAPGLPATSTDLAGKPLPPRKPASSKRAAGDPFGDADALVLALDRALRPMDVTGRTRDGDLVMILPELTAEEARAVVGLVIESFAGSWPSARAGVTTFPANGCDAPTLLAGASEACRARVTAGIAADDDQIVSIVLGERTIVLADPTMLRLFALIERIAVADQPVLVVGETGVGKEHAAYAVHHGSRRRAAPFVSLNCAALPDTLVESELFGFERGAFSGANASKIGLFERANGGTLFLDEMGELSLTAQAKLLRVLEGGRFTRLGDVREREVDVRVVAATNRDLAAEVAAHRFREDLFYRLNGAVVLIPPLRERPADIPVLARRFLATALARLERPSLAIAPAAMLALARYAWPGNVRELRNAMEYAAVVARDGVVALDSLPATILGRNAPVDGSSDATPFADLVGVAPDAPVFRPMAQELQELEVQLMKAALLASGGVKVRAAKLLSMPERTFRLKATQYGLDTFGSGDK
jgi:DNA-binding NtrC family response regulator